MAVNCADDGFLDSVGQLAPTLDEVAAVGVGEGLGAHFFDVGAGGEGLFRACENGAADGGVDVEGFEGGIEFEDEWGEESIEGFGAVDLNCVIVSCESGFSVVRQYLESYSCQRPSEVLRP